MTQILIGICFLSLLISIINLAASLKIKNLLLKKDSEKYQQEEDNMNDIQNLLNGRLVDIQRQKYSVNYMQRRK